MSIDSNTHLHQPDSRRPNTPAASGVWDADVCTALEAVQSAPEVRWGQVDELKRQVEDGSFRVDPRAIAAKLFRG